MHQYVSVRAELKKEKKNSECSPLQKNTIHNYFYSALQSHYMTYDPHSKSGTSRQEILDLLAGLAPPELANLLGQ